MQRFGQFIKFCLVGGSGMVVDMTMLYVLADPKMLGLNVTLSKICAAEIALVNNFFWNEVWTFKGRRDKETDTLSDSLFLDQKRLGGKLRRFLCFNVICGVGIVFAVMLLHLFHKLLNWNLYLSNLLTIGLITLWNFGMNVRYNWRKSQHPPVKSEGN